MRSVRDARPHLLAGLRVVVVVGRLLYLRPDLHAVVGIGLDQGLRREQPQVQLQGGRQPPDHGYRVLQAELLQLGAERVLLVVQVDGGGGRQELLVVQLVDGRLRRGWRGQAIRYQGVAHAAF